MSILYKNIGIIGMVNSEITSHTACTFGKAYGKYLRTKKTTAKILVAKDTRASGDMVISALSSGLCSVGVSVVDVGIIPVPALSYLIKKYKMDGGVMISAPKRTAEYTGICFLDSEGNLLSDDKTDKINALLSSNTDENLSDYKSVGRISRTHTGLRDYVDYVKSALDCRFRGIKIAVDCANGATFESAKLVFKELGADVEMIHNVPNGININDKCGYIDTESLQNSVRIHKCDLGVAFDGVGIDFAVTDENGVIISQDAMEKLCDLSSHCTDTACKDAISDACKLVRAYCMNDKKMSELVE